MNFDVSPKERAGGGGGGLQKLLPSLEGGGDAKGFGPDIFQFCSSPPPPQN